MAILQVAALIVAAFAVKILASDMEDFAGISLEPWSLNRMALLSSAFMMVSAATVSDARRMLDWLKAAIVFATLYMIVG